MDEKYYSIDSLKEIFENCMKDKDDIVYKLANCNGNYAKVSEEMDWGIDYDSFAEICGAYLVCNDEELRENILDFLTDINYHTEVEQLMENPDEFVKKVVIEDSEYTKEAWGF